MHFYWDGKRASEKPECPRLKPPSDVKIPRGIVRLRRPLTTAVGSDSSSIRATKSQEGLLRPRSSCVADDLLYPTTPR